MLLLFSASVYFLQPASAAEVAKPTHESTTLFPIKPVETVKFTTDEGTWMTVDVSPDGRTVVFDLLGDLYTVPITGGNATRIVGGMAWDEKPAFSPDGKHIGFVSDRTGHPNIWVVDKDGNNPRRVTPGAGYTFKRPLWMPDGKSMVVHRGGDEGSPNGLVRVPLAGGTATKIAAELGEVKGIASVSPDGKYFYFSSSPPGKTSSHLVKVALDNSARRNLTPNGREILDPVPSPDGQLLAYVMVLDTSARLVVRYLENSRERVVANPSLDVNGYFNQLSVPGYAFTPDSRELVFSGEGKLWRVDVATGVRREIPFTADVELGMGPRSQFEHATGADEPFVTARLIRFPQPSPDGKYIVFEALNQIWVASLKDGKALQLTDHTPEETTVYHQPVWSPDGRNIAYATWNPKGGGHVYRMWADDRCLKRGDCRPKRITKTPGYYQHLAYTPDGRSILAGKGDWLLARSTPPTVEALDLLGLPAAGGGGRKIGIFRAGEKRARLSGGYGLPHFGDNPDRVYLYDPSEPAVLEIDLETGARRELFKVFSFGNNKSAPLEVMLSPDGGHALSVDERAVYLITRPADGDYPASVFLADAADGPTPLIQEITRLGGNFVGWMPDGKRFFISLGHTLFIYDLADYKTTVSNGDVYEPARLDITARVSRDRPEGVVALRGARIITMKGKEIIERGDIVVTGNLITAIGAGGRVDIPRDAKIIDVAGKTILPGYVDLHAHWGPAGQGVHDPQPYSLLAYLSFGTTTMRDPQLFTFDSIPYLDLSATDQMISPRLFSTGRTTQDANLYGPDYFMRNLQDARTLARRLSEFYGAQTQKLAIPNRITYQWVLQAAREYRLTPTGETVNGLAWALDGGSGAEHAYRIPSPLYKDAARVLAKTGLYYDPTMRVAFGYYDPSCFSDQYDAHGDPRLRRFFPHATLDLILAGDSDRYHSGWRYAGRPSCTWFRQAARDYAKIVKEGGNVVMGSHGNTYGLWVHYEIWALAMGGMPVHDALRMATLVGSQGIGHGRETGSLEVGKLADLQILDRNPLEDIKNTLSIRYVMKNGRLYDSATLDEIWPRQRKLPEMWWWAENQEYEKRQDHR